MPFGHRKNALGNPPEAHRSLQTVDKGKKMSKIDYFQAEAKKSKTLKFSVSDTGMSIGRNFTAKEPLQETDCGITFRFDHPKNGINEIQADTLKERVPQLFQSFLKQAGIKTDEETDFVPGAVIQCENPKNNEIICGLFVTEFEAIGAKRIKLFTSEGKLTSRDIPAAWSCEVVPELNGLVDLALYLLNHQKDYFDEEYLWLKCFKNDNEALKKIIVGIVESGSLVRPLVSYEVSNPLHSKASIRKVPVRDVLVTKIAGMMSDEMLTHLVETWDKAYLLFGECISRAAKKSEQAVVETFFDFEKFSIPYDYNYSIWAKHWAEAEKLIAGMKNSEWIKTLLDIVQPKVRGLVVKNHAARLDQETLIKVLKDEEIDLRTRINSSKFLKGEEVRGRMISHFWHELKELHDEFESEIEFRNEIMPVFDGLGLEILKKFYTDESQELAFRVSCAVAIAHNRVDDKGKIQYAQEHVDEADAWIKSLH